MKEYELVISVLTMKKGVLHKFNLEWVLVAENYTKYWSRGGRRRTEKANLINYKKKATKEVCIRLILYLLININKRDRSPLSIVLEHAPGCGFYFSRSGVLEGIIMPRKKQQHQQRPLINLSNVSEGTE